MEVLDATKIEPRFKHATIFQTYEDLTVGESFILHNDHDPKPLYYHFTAEKGKEFGWEYLKKGPDDWDVKISKLKVE
jgi:regulator of cell morphogenesis and NO signaling